MSESIARAAAVRLREDLANAASGFVLGTIGASPWTPRTLRRAIFALAGASLRSAPGTRLRFAGDPHNLRIDRGVYLNDSVFIEATVPVHIGRDCAIGPESMILTSHHPFDEAGSWQSAPVGRAVRIGNRVWIGARAVILPGAVIESNVVIAAGAVVAGRCREYGVYAGVPARRIRDLRAHEARSS